MIALIVDDSRAMRRMLNRILTDLGFEVVEAENGQDALARIEKGPPPELMLVDWNMPVMNGRDFVEAVRRRPDCKTTRIMMVTTETGIDRVTDALAAGANEYLMKPFTHEALSDKLRLLGVLPKDAPVQRRPATPAVPAPAARATAAAEPKPAPRPTPAPASSGGQPKLKVLLVDDSAVVRRFVGRLLSSEPDFEVQTADDGQQGLDRLDAWSPDVVVLDVEMPVLDGLSTLNEIRKRSRSLPVIMFSTLTERGASITLTALAAGASAYLTKPSGAASIEAAQEELRIALGEQIRSLCRRPSAASAPSPTLPMPTVRSAPSNERRNRGVDVLIIASSTGGPVALADVIPRLPKNLPVPVLVVQHMPELFTAMLAKSLDGKSQLAVAEGRAGEVVQPGTVWIAPGGLHMEVRRDQGVVTLVTHDGPREQSVRPAADVLFRSVVDVYGGNVLAVVLTGMGCDGLNGCEHVAKAGGQIVVQDQETSVVWGMPGFVARANLADAILPLDKIADEIVARTSKALARAEVRLK